MANISQILCNRIGNMRSLAAVSIVGCIIVAGIVMAGTSLDTLGSHSVNTGSGKGIVSGGHRIDLEGSVTARPGPLLQALLPQLDSEGEVHTVLPHSGVHVRDRRADQFPDTQAQCARDQRSQS